MSAEPVAYCDIVLGLIPEAGMGELYRANAILNGRGITCHWAGPRQEMMLNVPREAVEYIKRLAVKALAEAGESIEFVGEPVPAVSSRFSHHVPFRILPKETAS